MMTSCDLIPHYWIVCQKNSKSLMNMVKIAVMIWSFDRYNYVIKSRDEKLNTAIAFFEFIVPYKILFIIPWEVFFNFESHEIHASHRLSYNMTSNDLVMFLKYFLSLSDYQIGHFWPWKLNFVTIFIISNLNIPFSVNSKLSTSVWDSIRAISKFKLYSALCFNDHFWSTFSYYI